MVNRSAFIVTADDGRMFSCAVEEVGSQRQRRWIFVDTDGTRYIGPPWTGALHEAQLRALVQMWWSTKRELGQAGMNAQKLRDRLATD